MGKGLLLRGPGAQGDLRALVRGYCLWARVARVSPWSWCSVRFARIGARIRPMGKDCAFSPWSWCSARVARIGTRIWLMGNGCACFSVVLVLSAIACVGVRIRPLGKVALAFPCLGARVFSLDIFGVPV